MIIGVSRHCQLPQDTQTRFPGKINDLLRGMVGEMLLILPRL